MSDAYTVVARQGIGDTLHLTGPLAALKRTHPQRPIHVFCFHDHNHLVLRHNPNVDRLVRVPAFLHRVAWRLIRATRRPLPTDYGNFRADLIYRRPVSQLLAESMGLAAAGELRPELFLTASEREKAVRLLAGLPRPLVAVHPWARCSMNKVWPLSSWRELMRRFDHLSFLQLGGSNDPPLGERVRPFLGRPLRESFAILAACDLVVSIESGLSHAAAALSRPAVVLFGPSSPATYGHADHINLYRPPECSPCMDLMLEECPFGRRCMHNIEVDTVASAVTAALRRINAVQADRLGSAEPMGHPLPDDR